MATFIGVEFDEDTGPSVALISNEWLTPRKRRAYFPRARGSAYNNLLKKHRIPDDTWELCELTKQHFDCDDLEKALRKLKKLEDTSDVNTTDIQSEGEGWPIRKNRSTFVYWSSESEKDFVISKTSKLKRPPAVELTPPPPEPKRSRGKQKASSLPQNQDSYIPRSRNTFPDSSPHTPEFEPRFERASSPGPSNASGFNRGERTINSPKPAEPLAPSISLLIEIREQNKQILSLLRNLSRKSSRETHVLSENIPVQFPINDENDVKKLELFLKNKLESEAFVLYLASVGGKDYSQSTHNILKHLWTNNLAKEYSFFGSRQDKKAFNDLLIKDVVIRAVKHKFSTETSSNIEHVIKDWLKYAPQRMKYQHKRNRRD